MPSEPGRLRVGPADIVDIHQLMALYTHLLDNREFGRLGEVFADDAEADYSSGGVTRRLTGLDDIVTFLSDANASSAHHISNVFVVRAGWSGLRSDEVLRSVHASTT